MNYTEIVETALSYSDRSDKEVTDRMDNFLRIVEARINRNLKTMDMAVRTLLSTTEGTEFYTLPSDFSGLRDIELRESASSRTRNTLQYLSPEQMNQRSSASDVGRNAVYYTLVANQIQIMPPQEAGKIMEIVYYRRVIPLTESEQENWVSIINPDVYIFGLLVEISSFVKDKEAAALWDSRFTTMLEEVKVEDGDSRWSGTSLTVRVG